MGQKVNYNKKKTNKIQIILIVILCLFSLVILIKTFQDVLNERKQLQNTPVVDTSHALVKDYNSIESLLANYNCKVITKNESADYLEVKVAFNYNLYDGDKSNERYFNRICELVAEYIKYKNFRLIDESKKIDIEVKCEENSIAEIKINNDLNYYLNEDSKINSKKSNNKITEFSIQSKELNDLNNGNWTENKVDFGTKESTIDGYNIYFDEGIKYKNVARNIFNVIFTKNYKNEVAGGLKVNSSPTEVKASLGEPTFKDAENIYGYIGTNNYLFFDFINKEISVYPVVNVTKDDEEILKGYIEKMNETNDVKKFVTDLTGYWLDFDLYNFDSNFVDLRYTLKGIQIKISSNSLKNGIFIYSNYSGNLDIKDLENVYMVGSDIVFDTEKERILNDNLIRKIEGAVSEEERKDFGINFALIFDKRIDNGGIGARFYSRDKQFADSELDNNLEISSYKWYDESKLIYSVNNQGIYIYNCETRENRLIVEIEDDIIINLIESNKIVYNEDEVILINII